ncbi:MULTISPECIES: hypothetical protein [Pseudoalteromonas]|uniref:DUF3649 domain-containing protein n=2 Tax=Pseudoalteromonas TaxID=53246 RepID=A0A4Q7DZ40_9GAMM|nr:MULTISPECIES: hypothetical protein [Pseudoalteromonas]QTL37916.1 hypothetical protein J5X90_19425 [Pseudoalteromonas viridis]RZM73136.1 hypothetical protein C3B51_21210 [Pseudoalteromonas rubra]
MPLSSYFAYFTAYRLNVVARFAMAIFGGYALTALSISLMSLLLPVSKVDAVLFSVCLSVLIHCLIFIAVFAIKSLRFLCGGLLLLATLQFMLLLILRG